MQLFAIVRALILALPPLHAFMMQRHRQNKVQCRQEHFAAVTRTKRSHFPLPCQPKDDSSEGVSAGIPQLPPIGDSSFLDSDVPESKPFVASRKVQLQYTCNVCETRNTQSMSRIAYHKGVVIVRCKGCDTQHLVADHLGWTGFQNNTVLEDFLGDVPRVTEEVFELERILQQHDHASGAILGEDGSPALE